MYILYSCTRIFGMVIMVSFCFSLVFNIWGIFLILSCCQEKMSVSGVVDMGKDTQTLHEINVNAWLVSNR